MKVWRFMKTFMNFLNATSLLHVTKFWITPCNREAILNFEYSLQTDKPISRVLYQDCSLFYHLSSHTFASMIEQSTRYALFRRIKKSNELQGEPYITYMTFQHTGFTSMHVAIQSVSSYLAISPLPRFWNKFRMLGWIISVALSVSMNFHS